MKLSAPPPGSLGFLFLGAMLAALLASCERKPNAAELEEAVRAREVTPAPATPKPGDWMYDKNRKSKLDATPRR